MARSYYDIYHPEPNPRRKPHLIRVESRRRILNGHHNNRDRDRDSIYRPVGGGWTRNWGGPCRH